MHSIDTPTAEARFIPVTKWPDYYPWPSIAGMRDLIFHANHNGFGSVIKRVGRRVLIDEAAFIAWVRKQGVQA